MLVTAAGDVALQVPESAEAWIGRSVGIDCQLHQRGRGRTPQLARIVDVGSSAVMKDWTFVLATDDNEKIYMTRKMVTAALLPRTEDGHELMATKCMKIRGKIRVSKALHAEGTDCIIIQKQRARFTAMTMDAAVDLRIFQL